MNGRPRSSELIKKPAKEVDAPMFETSKPMDSHERNIFYYVAYYPYLNA